MAMVIAHTLAKRAAATVVVIALLVIPAALLGCAVFGSGESKPTSSATPVLPQSLASLPRAGRIDCKLGPGRGGDVAVWELPGVEPGDPNSAYQGNRGERLGALPSCTPVAVTKYAWSHTDREFWVYVVKPGTVEGWVPLSLVEVDAQ